MTGSSGQPESGPEDNREVVRTEPASPAEPEDLQGRLVRAPSRIEAILNQLRRQRALLSVRVGGTADWRTSMVLAVDGMQQTLLLDPPHPPPPQPPSGALLSIRGRVDGSDLRFSCRASAPVDADGTAALLAEFPDHVLVLERRAAFRLNLPEFLRLPPSRVGHEHAEHDVRLVDLSHTGTGAIVPDHVEPAVGDTLRVRLQLPDAVIDTEAEVRSITPGRDGIRVGLQLGTLAHEDETRLSQAISRLERQLIRATRASR